MKYPGRIVTTRNGSENEESRLVGLPNELILMVVSHLRALRLDTTQAQAFKNKVKEKERQNENYRRRFGLYGLCLTCKRLNWLVTPTLYSSVIGSTTRYGFYRLCTYWETFIKKPELHTCLEYAENLLSDFKGNNLVDDLDLHGEYFVQNYHEKFANIINVAPNMQQMSITSLETNEISIWNSLILGRYLRNTRYLKNTELGLVSKMGLPKLEKLSVQINGSYTWGPDLSTQIFYSLLGCPALTELRIRGTTSGSDPSIPLSGVYAHLQRLELTECELNLQSLDNALSFCPGLRQLVCQWSCTSYRILWQRKVVLPNLLKLHNTLEKLWLVGSVHRIIVHDPEEGVNLNLSNMPKLKEAKLSNFFIANNDSGPDDPATPAAVSIASALPASLEHLAISYSTGNLTLFRFVQLGSSASADLTLLAEECPLVLPCLKELIVHFDCQGEGEGGGETDTLGDYFSNELVPQAFAEQGLSFSMVGELDILTMLD